MPSGRRGLTRRRLLLSGLGGAAVVAAGPGALHATGAIANVAPSIASRPRRGVSSASGLSADVPTAWFDLALDLVQHTAGFSPPVASRAFACLGVTLYEAMLPAMPEHRSLGEHLEGLAGLLPAAPASPAHHWLDVVNAALAATARGLFSTAEPANLAAIDRLEERLADRHHHTSSDRGRHVAAAVLAWAAGDGGHEGQRRNFPEHYAHPTGAGLWEPTPPDFQPALQPYWGDNRPFVVDSGAAIPAQDHTPYSTDPDSKFFVEAIEVYEAVNELTTEQGEIARFWADDPGATPTPPGHSVAILTQVLREDDATLETAAEAYARLGMAVADAFVCCWHVKYDTNLLRPVTYINEHIDPAWESYVGTPPFPEYPSGHSVQTAAAVEVITAMFGNRPFTDRTHDERGLEPRRFESFTAAAEEAAISRLYGGIHYRPAIELGLDQGRHIGRAVAELALRA